MTGKKSIFRACVYTTVLFIMFSCLSAPEQPKWIERHPSEDKYYIGIGSSDDPVQSVAAAKARQDALSNLAASISTSIIAETATEISESAEGDHFQSFKRRIEERVYQTLEGAEVVDSYYSLRQGYWIYMRISRDQLEKQKKELARRIEELLVPVYTEEDLTASEALSLLQKGHELLLDSPYFAGLAGELGDTRGNLLDLIERKTANILSLLSITVQPDSLEGRAGETAEASARVQGDIPSGSIPLLVSLGDEVLKSGTTREEGLYEFQIDLSRIPLGRGSISVDLQLEALGIDRSDYYLNLPSVQTEIAVDVLPLPLRFVMEYDADITATGIPEMASALFFTSGLPFSLADEQSDTEYTLRCKLLLEDFPRYRDNTLEISQARLIIQVEYQGQILHTYQSADMKDGGLTISQAHERTIKKLFQKLAEEQDYLPGLIEALPIRISRESSR